MYPTEIQKELNRFSFLVWEAFFFGTGPSRVNPLAVSLVQKLQEADLILGQSSRKLPKSTFHFPKCAQVKHFMYLCISS